jgi:hypothetical protein
VAALQTLEPGLWLVSMYLSFRSGLPYRILIWSLYFDTNQVQIFVIQDIVDLAVLALLPAAALALSIVVLFFFVYHESGALL